MNELAHIHEFETALQKYQISAHGLNVLQKTNVALLLAPSSTGRNTIIEELIKKGTYYFIVSDTTRKPRINNGIPEKNGREYWFRTEEEMLEEIQRGDFIEAEIIHGQQVSGTSIREFEKANTDDKTAITDIDIEGLDNIMKVKTDTHGFLLLPPSFDEWQRRLSERGAMDPKEHVRRMETALRIFEYASDHPELILIVNDELQQAVEELDQYVQGTAKQIVSADAQTILHSLMDATRAYLKSSETRS